MEPMHFVFDSDIYPFTHTTRRQKYIDPRYQDQYLPSKEDMQWQIKKQMMDNGWEMIPGETPVDLTIILTVTKDLHRRDLSNQVKAIEDALQGLVFSNDAWVDYILAQRSLGDVRKAVVQVYPRDPDLVQRDLEQIDIPGVFRALGLGDIEWPPSE